VVEEAGGTTGLLAGSSVRSSRRCVGLASAQRSGKESERERDIGSNTRNIQNLPSCIPV